MRALRRRIPLRVLFPLLVAMATPGVGFSDALLEDGDNRALYALGVHVGRNLQRYGLSEEELEVVQRGIDDVVLRRPILVNASSYRHQLDLFLAERQQEVLTAEKEASAEFVAEARAHEGAEVTESGCVVLHLRRGGGATPGATDKIRILYHGRLRDGTVFDSSVERGSPEVVDMRAVPTCLREGLGRMQVGGKASVVSPAEAAFGDRGKAPWIPGGAALSYEIELLDIVEKKPARAARRP